MLFLIVNCQNDLTKDDLEHNHHNPLDPTIDNDDNSMVSVTEQIQEKRVKEEELKCLEELYKAVTDYKGKSTENVCMPVFDTVKCWPLTNVNKTLTDACPNYINKFNMKGI